MAHLLELFGGEGLLRPAMHYRWDFDDTNVEFLSKDFSAALAVGADDATRDAVFAFASERMRGATAAFGVTEELVPEIERSYEEFLDLFDAHLAGSPYLLGGRPTIADYGFFGPLYAHLARDPYPSVLMKQRAQRVWRWVERMHAPVLDASEYGDCSEDLFAGDAVPDTLRALLSYIGDEYLDEAMAQVAAVDGWLAEHPEVADGEVVLGKPKRRLSGTTTFAWRGQDMTVAVVPYRMFLIKRVQDAHRAGSRGASRRPSGTCSPRPGSTRCSTSGPGAGWSGPTTARCGARPRNRCSPPDGRHRRCIARGKRRRRPAGGPGSLEPTDELVGLDGRPGDGTTARQIGDPSRVGRHPGVDGAVESEPHETVQADVHRHDGGLGEGRSRSDQPRTVTDPVPQTRPARR